MHRCLELARLGSGYVAPNPMVGAVLVYNDRIIGEGYHQRYGEAHAEVNCIASVQEANRPLIPLSTLYVSLEPCAHFGKTPPCADLILQHKIPKVIIGCRDPFKEVDGKGIEKLKAAGVEVDLGILENDCKELNKRFFTFHTQRRPYIILKWAQTADNFIAASFPTTTIQEKLIDEKALNNAAAAERLLISNPYSNRLVHKWRSEEAAILVGTHTALHDDPALTTRLWSGPSPVRLVVDMDLRLPSTLQLFNGTVRTIIFNSIKQEDGKKLQYYKLNKDENSIGQMMEALYESAIQSVLVEGGARLLQSFIDAGVWDETRVITNPQLIIGNGLPAPVLKAAVKVNEVKLHNDIIEMYKPKER